VTHRQPTPSRTAGLRARRAPAFDPLGYPGARPAGPVLVTDDAVLAVAVTADPAAPVRVRTPRAAVLRDPAAVRWVVAYGANACPDRLRDKGLTGPGALLLPARIDGWVPAFEARTTGYGAVPLTLVPAPGVTTATWVLGLHRDLVPVLDRTEGRVAGGAPRSVDPAAGTADAAPPGAYRLGRVGTARVAARFALPGALAYLPGPGTRVQRTADRWRTWPDHDQAAARRHLAAGRPSAVPVPVAAPVLGSWPATPLVPLTPRG
jgi:hypothetical protein